MLALLRLVPWIARILSKLHLWLMRSKWGGKLVFFLAAGAGVAIERVLTWLGLAIVASEYAAPPLLAFVSGPLLGMPDPYAQLLAMTNIDKAATILISAVVVRMGSKINIIKKPVGVGGV